MPGHAGYRVKEGWGVQKIRVGAALCGRPSNNEEVTMDPILREILNGYRENALDMAHELWMFLADLEMTTDDHLRRARLVAEAFVAEVRKYEEKKELAKEMWDAPVPPTPHAYKMPVLAVVSDDKEAAWIP